MVDTQVRYYCAEVCARILDGGAIDFADVEIRLLHHIFGIGDAAKHTVGDREEQRPVRLELQAVILLAREAVGRVESSSFRRAIPANRRCKPQVRLRVENGRSCGAA